MEYSGAGCKLIDEKNQKQKISWHCPFKLVLMESTVPPPSQLTDWLLIEVSLLLIGLTKIS